MLDMLDLLMAANSVTDPKLVVSVSAGKGLEVGEVLETAERWECT